MNNFLQQSCYTIDEIRVKFAHQSAFDWDCPYGPFIDEPVTWEQWREAFPPPKREDSFLGSSVGNVSPPGLKSISLPERDPNIWSSSIFDAHPLPAAAFLDPEGWTEIMKLGRRNSEHWRKLCPNTYNVATALFDGLIQKDLWGFHHGKGQWKTVTAGKKPKELKPADKDDAEKITLSGEGQEKVKRTWPDKSLKLIDVLNALGNPDKYALGSTDARLNVYERESIWRHPFYETRVNRLRIDVDMNRAWGQYAIFDQDRDEVAVELSRESALIKGLGLSPYFFMTGKRGHQIVIPIPTLDRSVASLLVLMIRYLLAEGRVAKKQSRYKVLEVDKSNLDCLVRLPLGRHAETKSVAWMIDADTATVLPPEQQADAVACAWNYGGIGCEPLEQSREALVMALDNMHFDRDLTVYGATADADRFQALAEIIRNLPECSILHTFHATCDAWQIPSLRRTPGGATSSVSQQPYYICGAVSLDGAIAVPPTVVEQGRQDSEITSPAIRMRVKLGKGWARQVVNEGFTPGGFYEWSSCHGKNGIGAAILFCDGDRERAEDLLVRMAREVDCCSEAERQKRIDWIKWAVPRNNIDTHFERPELSQHRDLHGIVLESETERAIQIVDELVRRRQASDLRRKVFDDKALTTLQHIIELIQMEARNSEDGIIRVSARTLAAEISTRWPEDATDGKDISRQMVWIVRKATRRMRRVAMATKVASDTDKCLFCVLEQMPTSRRAFDAKGYVLGNDLIAMLPVEE